MTVLGVVIFIGVCGDHLKLLLGMTYSHVVKQHLLLSRHIIKHKQVVYDVAVQVSINCCK